LLLLCAVAGGVQAGMFDDEEARKQIAAERKRLDALSTDIKNQQQAADTRFAKVEEALKSQALLDLFTQIEALKADLNKLRGQIEVLNNNVENSAKRQRDMYTDLDSRLTRIEQHGGAVPPVPTAAPAAVTAPVTAPVAATPAPAAAASAAATTASPPASIPGDPAAEARNYDAAQAQRRLGNYQGAIVAFQNFLAQYPKSNLAPRAQYWIGDSYFNLRDFRLAIAAQQTLVKTYPDSATVPDAMLNIASSQIEMGETIAGKKSLEEILQKFPISEAAGKAKRRLAAMSAVSGAPAAKQ
jgi:tol-pal system protein YbgF